jgi:hypothetical protein
MFRLKKLSSRINSAHRLLIFKAPLMALFFLSLRLTAVTTVAPVSFYADTTNLALTATVTTSFVSSWETLTAVRDGITPSSSGDKSNGAYGNWNGEANYGTYNWVQYEWTLAKNITSTSVYWWSDGLGIQQPVDAYIEYWTGNSWVGAGAVGTSLNQYNGIKTDIQTSRIRIFMKSARATGILEWRVFGIETGPCDPSTIVPKVRAHNGPVRNANTVNVIVGDSVTFMPESSEGGRWTWAGPVGFIASGREIVIRNTSENQSGTYTVNYLNSCGATTTAYFHLTVSSSADISAPFEWTPYNPVISYDFRDEFPAMTQPTQDLNDCPGVVGSQSSGWWTFKWGANANTLVTAASITPMLARMNEEFAYFRDVMGWPPDKRAKNGYRSAIYLYGSGLCTDNATNTALGGWQSSISYQGQNWPMVLLSYYPVYSFDPACTYGDRSSQMSAVVHEGIHSILADLPGCKKAAWFHEGGNTWLQQEATARKSGNYSSMGFLNGASFIAPFMPIECYSGWLQDDSFGGPSAEGVNMFQDGTQISTWRNLLGGVQYSNTFPTFLGITLGKGSIAWIWRNCPERVLEGMAAAMGEVQIRRLITEYRARQALVDMGEWTDAVMKLMNSQFGTAIRAEGSNVWLNPDTWYASPYVKTTRDANNVLTPEYRTTPGWSGGNQIPLVVNGPVVTVNFQPLGPNMTLQLCYRTRDGQTVYSKPVNGGDCSLAIDLTPANNVVFAVISNTDYIYNGEATRKAHFDYRIKLVEGVSQTADVNKKWFDWTKVNIPTAISETRSGGPDVVIFPNPSGHGTPVNFELGNAITEPVNIEVMNMNGRLIWSGDSVSNKIIPATSLPSPGIYFASFRTASGISVRKIVVR